MPYTAKHRFAPISARKARLVIDLIRGRGVQEALDILQFQPQRSAYLIRKVLRSAMAAAEEQEAEVEELVVTDARVDPGPMQRRVWRRGRGRADLLKCRTSHIVITLGEAGQ